MATIEEDWSAVLGRASKGQKAWLTQLKNHYAKVIRDDPEGAALVLAMYEHQFGPPKC
jgi:hypothetical protein